MHPFALSVTPAVRSHLDAQISFASDLSKSFFNSLQQSCDLSIQMTQTLLEETTLASQQLITHRRPAEALAAASVRAEPAAEMLRAYQQHISRVAADVPVELARVTERHVRKTSRIARALADEVQHAASGETGCSFSAPFKTAGAGMRGNGGGSRKGA